MRKLFFVLAAGLGAAIANAVHAGQPITDVRVKLPTAVQWYQAGRLSMGQQALEAMVEHGVTLCLAGQGGC